MGTLFIQRSVHLTVLVCLPVGLVWLLLAGIARANVTVGTGTPGSCTDAALSVALAGGGLVDFNCGSAPVTITVGSTKDIVADTQIDGGGKVTLSGGDAVRVLKVAVGVTLELKT